MAKGKTVKKSAPAKKAGEGAATAARSKDAGKQAVGKAAAKKPAAAKSQKSAASSRTAAKSPSLAGKVLRKVKATASGAVDLAGSLIGRESSEKSR